MLDLKFQLILLLKLQKRIAQYIPSDYISDQYVYKIQANLTLTDVFDYLAVLHRKTESHTHGK